MPVIVAMILQQIPGLIQQIKDMHAQVNPTLPPLTDAEAKDLLHQAVIADTATDEAWLRLKGLPPLAP
jgi:hypothetical protein